MTVVEVMLISITAMAIFLNYYYTILKTCNLNLQKLEQILVIYYPSYRNASFRSSQFTVHNQLDHHTVKSRGVYCQESGDTIRMPMRVL